MPRFWASGFHDILSMPLKRNSRQRQNIWKYDANPGRNGRFLYEYFNNLSARFLS
jgi:hypothetical protein